MCGSHTPSGIAPLPCCPVSPPPLWEISGFTEGAPFPGTLRILTAGEGICSTPEPSSCSKSLPLLPASSADTLSPLYQAPMSAIYVTQRDFCSNLTKGKVRALPYGHIRGLVRVRKGAIECAHYVENHSYFSH
ncbi:hypothetical protein DR999_PMT12651 [Platysternon megacephalum]|uniref:Uncharacterized protein n=1 Tax=Platysternon megacephalum TaxID=55544 RepID=A0A4D9E1U8_9SAUR|nr:hypothetical protein DR999_PMT12651 [Platysternon megacephalum]